MTETTTTIVSNRQLWQALREIVPDLPETTRRAVLHAFRNHAWLEWEEVREEAHESYWLTQRHTWPTLPDVVALWHTLGEKVGGIPQGLQEARIEIRDLDIHLAVEIEGRALWMIPR